MRRALVTGCSRGIGRAVTLALLQQGWDVVGLSRTPPDWCEPNDGLIYESEHFRWERNDLGWQSIPRWLLRDGSDTWLDALIHCAAVQGPVGAFAGLSHMEWSECVRINLLGTYDALRWSLPYLKRSDDGRALLFAGGGAFNPRLGYSAYAASKAGVVSLMETVAAELEETSVTVNCIAPGYVPTSMTEDEDRASPQMDRAVACVMHMLSPATTGLTGKTISAEYDDWALITPDTVESLNLSNLGTRHRYLIRLSGRTVSNADYSSTLSVAGVSA